MSLAKLLKSGNDEKARDLILQEDFNPNLLEPKTKQNALHLLVKESQTELLKDLLEKPCSDELLKPNLEARDFEDKVEPSDQTPLATALLLGNEDAAVLLLNSGADPNSLYDRQNMLMLCASVKKPRVANVLLLRGADPNFTNKTGSAVHYSLEAENDQMFSILLSHQGVAFCQRGRPADHKRLEANRTASRRQQVPHMGHSQSHRPHQRAQSGRPPLRERPGRQHRGPYRRQKHEV